MGDIESDGEDEDVFNKAVEEEYVGSINQFYYAYYLMNYLDQIRTQGLVRFDRWNEYF